MLDRMTRFVWIPLLAVGTLHAAEVAPAAFSQRGKLLFEEKFSDPALAAGWTGKLGKWEMVDGAAKISELAEDKHAAVRRHALGYHDAIFEFSFQFNAGKMIALSVNNKQGHVCRLIITPKSLVLQADKPNAKSELKAERLAVLDMDVSADRWHQAVVEIRGARMLAQVDGGRIIAAESARIDGEKADLGFPVTGVGVLLDNVKVYAIR